MSNQSFDVSSVSLDIANVQSLYQSGKTSPKAFILELRKIILKQLEQDLNPVWIYFLDDEEVLSYLDRLEDMDPSLPLYGIPFAIKDNIDLVGVPTTAACEAFAYVPQQSAFVVQRLIDAGAIPIGKTNLDQFATGLVGVRSPYGACKNALNPEYISGGSSSGSAVAVAKNWVSFSLGTDTAGSGRVPASLHGLVGVKPSRGLLSCTGVVPACRSLDCVSIFSQTIFDANRVLDVACEFDPTDAYARRNRFNNGTRFGGQITSPMTIGIPKPEQLEFFDDEESATLFAAGVAQLRDQGVMVKEIDFQPFLDAARLLYEGPWVTERYLACQTILEQNPDAMLDVTRSIIAPGEHVSAASAFKAQYRMQQLALNAAAELSAVDCILTPTNGTEYTIAEIEAEPIKFNSNLGYYTNFMNLLDCAALAIPLAYKSSGVGFGVTIFQQALSDKQLLGIGQSLCSTFKSLSTAQPVKAPPAYPWVDVVVCGAHLSGLPLNWQLTERGGRLLRSARTSQSYEFIALAGGSVKRPGVIRVAESGHAIDVEIWRLPVDEFGSFVAAIPEPLAIGKVELDNGQWLPGFVCEAIGRDGAQDISEYGSWKNYLADS